MAKVSLTLPILDGRDIECDGMADVSLNYDGLKQAKIKVSGQDASYDIEIGLTDEYFKQDVLIRVLERDEVIFNSMATNGDFDFEFPPDEDLVEDWRLKLAPAIKKTPVVDLDDLLDTMKDLPVLDVGPDEYFLQHVSLVLHVDLARSLTMLETFKLMDVLKFNRFVADEERLELKLVWL